MRGSCILGDMTRISVTHLSDLRGLICRRQTWHCYPTPLLFSAKDTRKYLPLQKIQSRSIRKICNFKVKWCIFKMVDNGFAISGMCFLAYPRLHRKKIDNWAHFHSTQCCRCVHRMWLWRSGVLQKDTQDFHFGWNRNTAINAVIQEGGSQV